MLWCIFTTADSAHRSPTAESITTRMNPEQLDKMMKLEGWQKELKLLEDKKAELAAS